MRVVFMGTPDFAAASLQKMIDEQFNVVGVFTQPDKPKGRGMETTNSPVKQIALDLNIPLFQPEKMRDDTVYRQMILLQPDVVVVVAFGRIIPPEVFAIPRFGTINVHGSLLPKYRGAAPIQWAVLNGEERTGVTTMYIAREMDTGNIIHSAETEIGERESSGELFDRLKHLGADLLVKTLRDIEQRKAPSTPQNHAEATYAPPLDKSMSPINWDQTPRMVSKWIYGLQPWPVATMELEGETYRAFATEYTQNKTDKKPGEIVSAGEQGVEIACAAGETILITELQAPGKKRMKAADFLRGHSIKVE